jgi:hypothetical protein
MGTAYTQLSITERRRIERWRHDTWSRADLEWDAENNQTFAQRKSPSSDSVAIIPTRPVVLRREFWRAGHG